MSDTVNYRLTHYDQTLVKALVTRRRKWRVEVVEAAEALHGDAIDNRAKLLSAGGILLAPGGSLTQVQRGDMRELHALTDLLTGLHGSKMVFPGQVQWELDIIMGESGRRLCFCRRWEDGA